MMDSLKNPINVSGMKSKSRFWASVRKAFLNQKLNSCRKQAEMKILEKKDKNKKSMSLGGQNNPSEVTRLHMVFWLVLCL